MSQTYATKSVDRHRDGQGRRSLLRNLAAVLVVLMAVPAVATAIPTKQRIRPPDLDGLVIQEDFVGDNQRRADD